MLFEIYTILLKYLKYVPNNIMHKLCIFPRVLHIINILMLKIYYPYIILFTNLLFSYTIFYALLNSLKSYTTRDSMAEISNR